MRTPRKNPTRDRRSGSAMVEFALTLLLPLAMIMGMFAFVWTLFVHATLHNAVREGVRYAITGNPGGSGLDDAVKQRIKVASGGLLNNTELDAHVSIEFFDPDCPNGQTCPATPAATPATSQAVSSSIVKVTVNCYSIGPFANLTWGSNNSAGFPFSLTVSASDKMEPFPGAPPSRGTMASPTACP